MTESGAQTILIAILETATTVAQSKFVARNDRDRGEIVEAVVQDMERRVKQAIENDRLPPDPTKGE